jgi:hypothetical protein
MTEVSAVTMATQEEARVQYDLRVRTVMGPVARASVAPGAECSAAGRGAVFRFHLVRDCDLAELYRVLLENDVDVISIRAARRRR